MALILCIETTTTNCSVSLSKDGETLVLKEDNNKGFSHAEKLHVFIDEVLSETNYKKHNLEAIAVSKGPGSYTGLRIGVSAAKGLCFALNIPLISISTLKALAMQINVSEGFIISMLDARRLEVYSEVFDSDYNSVRPIDAEIVENDSFSTFLETEKVFFVGNGVSKTQDIIEHPNAEFINHKLPSAMEMGKLAEEKYKISDIEDVAYFEPYYLKDFVGTKSK